MICFDSYQIRPYHYALMSSGLPEFLDLARVSRQPLEQVGRVRIGGLSRLGALLADNGGETSLSLTAGDDGSGRVHVRGEVQATLGLVCQRCLQPMRYEVATSFDLVWVTSEQDVEVVRQESCDPLLSADGRVKLSDLIEDELILALPIVALHDTDECNADRKRPDMNAGEPQMPAKQNPFAALAKLKQRR